MMNLINFGNILKIKKTLFISRISTLYGPGVFFSLDSYFKGIVNKHNKIEKIPKANYKFFYVDILFDKEILDFVSKNKIECLFIKKGGDLNLNDLFNCENLKFVFDNSNKKFLFRINGILQSF